MIQALSQFLTAAAKSSGEPDIQLIRHSAERSFERPTLGLELRGIHENVVRRDGAFRIQAPGEKGHLEVSKFGPPVWMDLDLTLTVYGSDQTAELQLLGRVLQACFRANRIPKEHVPLELMAEDLGEPTLLVAQREMGVMCAGHPSIGLLATAGFNPHVPETVKRVRQAILATTAGPFEGPSPRSIVRTDVSAAGMVLGAPEGAEGKRSPVVGARVSVDGRDKETFTREEGVFLLEGLPPGRHSLRVEAVGYETARQEVLVPTSGRNSGWDATIVHLERSSARFAETVRLEHPSVLKRLSGRLTYPGGEVAAHIPVRCGEVVSGTDADGRYVLLVEADSEEPVLAQLPGIGDVPLDALPPFVKAL